MTHKAKVLALLSDHQPHTHHELYRLGCVAHSRVSDLRCDGYSIRAWREGDVYLYQLDRVLAEAAADDSFRPSSVGSPVRPVAAAASASTPLALVADPSSEEGRARADEWADGGVLSLFEVAR